MEITRTPKGILLTQTAYADKVLHQYRMENCHSESFPMEPQKKPTGYSDKQNKKIKFPFREALGSLQYLACKTRPDLSFSVNYLSTKMATRSAGTDTNQKDLQISKRYCIPWTLVSNQK